MRVEPHDGVCRSCGGILEIVDVDDAAMTVECACGNTYLVEPDAFGDGAIHYLPLALLQQQERAGEPE